MMNKELKSFSEFSSEIGRIKEVLLESQNNKLLKESELSTQEESLRLAIENQLSEQSNDISEKINETKMSISKSDSSIQQCFQELEQLQQDLSSKHDTLSNDIRAFLALDDSKGDYINTIENVGQGGQEILDKIKDLMNQIDQIRNNYMVERKIIIDKLERKNQRMRNWNQAKRVVGKGIRGLGKILKTTGKIVFKTALIGASIAISVASGIISVLSKGAGMVGRSVAKGLRQSGIFQRTGGEIGSISLSGKNKFKSENEFSPGPEASKSFRYMFGDEAEISPIGGYAGNSHFGYVNPVNVNAKNPGWHIADEIGGLKQKRKIAVHTFVKDFENFSDAPSISLGKKDIKKQDLKPEVSNSIKPISSAHLNNSVQEKKSVKITPDKKLERIIDEKETTTKYNITSENRRKSIDDLFADEYKATHFVAKPKFNWDDYYINKRYKMKDSYSNYKNNDTKYEGYLGGRKIYSDSPWSIYYK